MGVASEAIPSFSRSSVRKSFFFKNSIQEKSFFFNFFKFCSFFFFFKTVKNDAQHQVFSSSSSSTLKYRLYIYEKIITNLLNITCNDFLPSIMFNREVKQLSKRNVSHTVFFLFIHNKSNTLTTARFTRKLN